MKIFIEVKIQKLILTDKKYLIHFTCKLSSLISIIIMPKKWLEVPFDFFL